MSDDVEPVRVWWEALDDSERIEARSVRGTMPAWMVSSLRAAGIPTYAVRWVDDVDPTLTYPVPCAVAEFIRSQRRVSELLVPRRAAR
jgi:hypothetical protein